MGKVGSTVAFALSLRGCVREMVLVGRNHAQVVGDAMDIAHAQSFVDVPTRVVAAVRQSTAMMPFQALQHYPHRAHVPHITPEYHLYYL